MRNELIPDHPKFSRGFGQFYGELFKHLDNKIITEIGIGWAISQIAWAKSFPKSQIVGIEVASPVLDDCVNAECHSRQHEFALVGMKRFSDQPMSIQKRIALHFNRSGYIAETAKEHLEAYGQVPFVIDDGKQNGSVHNEFKEAWLPNITKGGLLIRERAFRFPGYAGMQSRQAWKSLGKGWVLVDCRKYILDPHPQEPVNQQGFIAFWSDDRDKWINIFKPHYNLYTHENFHELEALGVLVDQEDEEKARPFRIKA